MRLLLSLSAFALVARAIHESEVGVVDWYTKLVGVPLYTSPLTKPVFHDDIVLTATSNNVLAALNATDGSIVWRSIHDAQDAIMGFKVHDDIVYAISGPSGSTLRVYDVSTGDLVHEKRLHKPVEGKVHDPPTLGIAVTPFRGQSGDQAIVLTNGDTVRCVLSSTGETRWHWRSEDHGSLVMYTHVYPDTRTSTLYVAGFAKSIASYTLHVTTLDLATGHVVASVNIPANMANALTDYLLLGSSRTESPSASDASPDAFGPCLFWLSPSSNAPNMSLSLSSAPLSPSLKGKVLAVPDASYKHIQDVDLSSDGLFMAFRDNGAAEVLSYASSGSPVKAMWDFGDVTSSTSPSESHFVGAPNGDGKPCVGKVAWSSVHNQAIHQTFEANLHEGTGQMTGFAFPFESNEHGTIRHIAFSPSAANDAPHKFLLVTSTGSLQLWDRSILQWVREESLATVQTTTIIELPPSREEIGSVGAGGKGESFWSKVMRQVQDAKSLPHYMIHFVTRFATGSYASPSSRITLASSGPSAPTLPYLVPGRSPASPRTLVRDPFSFRQLLIVSTSHGKLFALDTSTGAIVWSRILGLGWASEVGGRIVPVRAFVVHKTETGTDDGVPESLKGVALITQRVADNSLVDTVIFHFDPLTGEDNKIVAPTDGSDDSRVNVKSTDGKWISPLEGVDAIAGPLAEAFLVPDGKDTIGMLDEFLQVQLYPDTPSTRASFASLAPQLYLALRAGTQVLGHQVGLNDELSSFHVAFPTWGISFGENEEAVSITKSAHRGHEVASIGRVKGDRSTLYKYLNPHLSVVISAPRAPFTTSGNCGLYMVDTVKGTVLYHVSLPVVDGKCDIHAVLDENWLVYSYYDNSAEVGGAKSYRVVSVEMYEGHGPDEKISSSDITSYSNETTKISVYEQAFVIPHAVTAIATTETKFGVSTKDIIISSRKNAVHSIPRRLLNPRRPKRKPTNEEAEEMLVQYDPVLPDDGRLVMSHFYEVADVRQIVTAPSLLESTSLVLAVGTDLFLTRIATSGTFDVLSETFNKMQLVLTVIGLAVAIAITKPMVRQKQLRERWYQ